LKTLADLKFKNSIIWIVEMIWFDTKHWIEIEVQFR
jgi:hypothetical protein